MLRDGKTGTFELTFGDVEEITVRINETTTRAVETRVTLPTYSLYALNKISYSLRK